MNCRMSTHFHSHNVGGFCRSIQSAEAHLCGDQEERAPNPVPWPASMRGPLTGHDGAQGSKGQETVGALWRQADTQDARQLHAVCQCRYACQSIENM